MSKFGTEDIAELQIDCFMESLDGGCNGKLKGIETRQLGCTFKPHYDFGQLTLPLKFSFLCGMKMKIFKRIGGCFFSIIRTTYFNSIANIQLII